MKTLPTLAAALLAALVVLGPTVAYGATTVTVAAGAPSYLGAATITITGSVTPVPTVPTNVVLTITNPNGGVADYSSNAVSLSTGAYSYSIVAGGSANWNVPGTYTVTATVSSVSATTTFQYTPTGGVGTGSSAAPSLVVQLAANSPVWAGQTEQLAVLVSWNNGSLACDKPCFATVHFYTPDGNLVNIYPTSNPVIVHRGFFIWTWTVPASAPDGLYAIHAWASLKIGSVTYQGQGLGSYTVNSQLASASTVTAVKTELDSVSSMLTGVTSSLSSMTTQMGTLATSVTNIQSSLTTVQGGLAGIGDIKTSLASLKTSVDSVTSSVNTLSSTMTQIQSNLNNLLSSLGTLQTTMSGLSGLSGEITSLQNAISSNQTYVLVVAALAAITLVLELAILVRKLS
jgi:prefoldin subunit 5